MSIETTALLAVLIFLAATLYSSVGHAGASGYLAAMALIGLAPAEMKPLALMMNIIVASIATVRFYQAGYFSGTLLMPFAFASIPCAFIGGYVTLPGHLYKTALGIILIFAALIMFRAAQKTSDEQLTVKQIPIWAALLSGAVIGLLSGLTGTGGGIFLSPLLLFMGWAETRQSSGLSAGFILVNSIAGLLGNVSSVGNVSSAILFLAPAAIAGGFIGSTYGSKSIGNANLRRLLAVVLIITGLKLIFT